MRYVLSASRAMHYASGVDREDFETLIGEYLLAEATLAAHFVAVAEEAGLSASAINAHFVAIAERTGLEFWITDELGVAYLRSRPDVRFRFNPDPSIQPQASAFWPVLSGELSHFVQRAQVREIDDRVFKYAAVAGIDKPRIVQVGHEM
jgi:hypothetical protein